MEEHRHGVLGGFGFESFPAVSILRMVRTALDGLRLPCSMIPTHRHAVGGWVLAALLGPLGFGLATQRFAGEYVGQRHG